MKIFREILGYLFLPLVIVIWVLTMTFCGIFRIIERVLYNADFFWIIQDLDKKE